MAATYSIEEIRAQASLAVASVLVDRVKEGRTSNERLGHTWKFPPPVVRAVIFVQACLRRRQFLRQFGFISPDGGPDGGIDADFFEMSPPPAPLLAVSLYFCRRMRNPAWVNAEDEAAAVSGIINAKENVSMGDVLEVIAFYTGSVPESHFSLTTLGEKLDEMIVDAQEKLQESSSELESPVDVQAVLDGAAATHGVPPSLEERCVIGVKRRLREVVDKTEKELRRELVCCASVPEMDAVQVKVEQQFGPVQTKLREEVQVARKRRTQFLETELETRWSRPFAGPLPPHSLAARRYELELGTRNPKVQEFVKEEQHYVSTLEAAFEVRLLELQNKIRELSQKRRDARARIVIRELDERIAEVTEDVQAVIENAITQIGADNAKVKKRASDLLSAEAHTAVYSMHAEKAAEELRFELESEDPTPEAGDRRRSAAAKLGCLLDALNAQHPMQERLRQEFAVQLDEVARVRAASLAAKTAQPARLPSPDHEAADTMAVRSTAARQVSFAPGQLQDQLEEPNFGEPPQPPGLAHHTLEEESDDDDGWGALPSGFEKMEHGSEVTSFNPEQANRALPDFTLEDEMKVIASEWSRPDPQTVTALHTFTAEDGGATGGETPQLITVVMTLPELAMDFVRALTEPVFSSKVVRAITEAIDIPRERVKVTGIEEGSKVALQILEPGPDEGPSADAVLTELTRQIDDPTSKLRLGEIGPFLARASIDRGVAGPVATRMEQGTLSTAYAATNPETVALEKMGIKQRDTLGMMSTAEPQDTLLESIALPNSTWGASRLEPGTLQAAQQFRTTRPKAKEDETGEPWAAPLDRKPMYTFYDKKVEEVSKEPVLKLPTAKQKFATHASFHLTRHPAGGTDRLKGFATPAQPPVAAADSWLDPGRAQTLVPLNERSAAKDLDLPAAVSSETVPTTTDQQTLSKGWVDAQVPRGDAAGKTGQLQGAGGILADPIELSEVKEEVATKPKSKKKSKKAGSGASLEASVELDQSPQHHGEADSDASPGRVESDASPGGRASDGTGVDDALARTTSDLGGTLKKSKKEKKQEKKRVQMAGVEPAADEAEEKQRPAGTGKSGARGDSLRRSRSDASSGEAATADTSPASRLRQQKREAELQRRAAASPERRDGHASKLSRSPTGDREGMRKAKSEGHLLNTPLMSSMQEELPIPTSPTYAGMYGGLPETGLRMQHEKNSRLPRLVGRPSADDLKSPAYVRHAFRHSTVSCGPPYKISEEGQQDSPAWSAMQLLDASLDANDWRRCYSQVTKSRLMKLGPKNGIRSRSMSQPRLSQGGSRRPRLGPPGRPARAAWPSTPPESLPGEQDGVIAGGGIIADSIDPGEVHSEAKKKKKRDPRDPSKDKKKKKDGKDKRPKQEQQQTESEERRSSKQSERRRSRSSSKERRSSKQSEAQAKDEEVDDDQHPSKQDSAAASAVVKDVVERAAATAEHRQRLERERATVARNALARAADAAAAAAVSVSGSEPELMLESGAPSISQTPLDTARLLPGWPIQSQATSAMDDADSAISGISHHMSVGGRSSSIFQRLPSHDTVTPGQSVIAEAAGGAVAAIGFGRLPSHSSTIMYTDDIMSASDPHSRAPSMASEAKYRLHEDILDDLPTSHPHSANQSVAPSALPSDGASVASSGEPLLHDQATNIAGMAPSEACSRKSGTPLQPASGPLSVASSTAAAHEDAHLAPATAHSRDGPGVSAPLSKASSHVSREEWHLSLQPSAFISRSATEVSFFGSLTPSEASQSKPLEFLDSDDVPPQAELHSRVSSREASLPDEAGVRPSSIHSRSTSKTSHPGVGDTALDLVMPADSDSRLSSREMPRTLQPSPWHSRATSSASLPTDGIEGQGLPLPAEVDSRASSREAQGDWNAPLQPTLLHSRPSSSASYPTNIADGPDLLKPTEVDSRLSSREAQHDSGVQASPLHSRATTPGSYPASASDDIGMVLPAQLESRGSSREAPHDSGVPLQPSGLHSRATSSASYPGVSDEFHSLLPAQIDSRVSSREAPHDSDMLLQPSSLHSHATSLASCPADPDLPPASHVDSRSSSKVGQSPAPVASAASSEASSAEKPAAGEYGIILPSNEDVRPASESGLAAASAPHSGRRSDAGEIPEPSIPPPTAPASRAVSSHAAAPVASAALSGASTASRPDRQQDTGFLLPSAGHSSAEERQPSLLPGFLGEDQNASLSGLSDASEVLSEELMPRPGSPHGRVASEQDAVAPLPDPVTKRNAKNQVATRQRVDSYAQSLTSSILRNSLTDGAMRRVVPGRPSAGPHAAHVLHPRAGIPGRTSSTSPDHVIQGPGKRTSSSSPTRGQPTASPAVARAAFEGPARRVSPPRGQFTASPAVSRAVAPAPRPAAGGQDAPKPRAGHAIPLN